VKKVICGQDVVLNQSKQTGSTPLYQSNEHFEDVKVFGVAQWKFNQQMCWCELLRRLDTAVADNKYN
jgi:hypothetical protein